MLVPEMSCSAPIMLIGLSSDDKLTERFSVDNPVGVDTLMSFPSNTASFNVTRNDLLTAIPPSSDYTCDDNMLIDKTSLHATNDAFNVT